MLASRLNGSARTPGTIGGYYYTNQEAKPHTKPEEKRLGVMLKRSYVNRVTAMFNNGMIPPRNSDIIHRFLLGQTRPGEEIQMWKNLSWDG